MGDGGVTSAGERVNQSHVLFDGFVQASTCKGTLKAFQDLCDFLELKPNEYRVFYHKLKSRLNYWKAKALWAKLDKRASHKEFKKGRACSSCKCLIIGAGPCGLRTAIELAFLGAKVVLVEKRDAFSRNNVLHLWPFTIQDLRGLGAKKFYGKFCAGSIDHISIRQLQLMLLKMALLLGIEIHVNVEFKGLIEPPEDQENERTGWRANVNPRTHPVSELEFDVIIGADGRRNTLSGFRRKEFRGKLAIAITANFINRNTTAEAKVEEISGVAFIFNQKFFQDLREATGIDLENIVYYKDDTHYFVMTAKKQSLLEKGVILNDYVDTEMLLSRANVDQTALLAYAREAADFSTNHQLPKLDFAINHYGQPDVAMFDFTCMYASENAALVRQCNGHQLLVAIVGDSLLEPFWPMGTGIARGFLAALDSAWMVRSWAQGASALEVLAERESIYRLLPQTTPENVSKNFSQYTVDPATRYPNINLHLLRPSQVRHLIDTGESREIRLDVENVVNSSTPKLTRNELLLEKHLQESIARSSKLLSWCQRLTEGYHGVAVSDITTSWKSGLALCALIHHYRPDLIDFDSLDERDVEKNNQLAFDVAEKELGISPIMTGKEMSTVLEPDKLSMVMYLSQFYEMFKDTVPPGENHSLSPEEKAALMASTKSPISFLSKLGQNISRKRIPKEKKEKELDGVGKRRKTSQPGQPEDDGTQQLVREERGRSTLMERKVESTTASNHTKVKSMATQLLAKFEENAPAQSTGLKRQASRGGESPKSWPGSVLLSPPLPPLPPPFSSYSSLHTQKNVQKLEIIEDDDDDGDENDSTWGHCPLSCREASVRGRVPSVQERTEMLAARLTGQPHPSVKPQPMKKPSRFFIERWLQTHALEPQQQEEQRLPPSGRGPSHIPSIQERAERLDWLFNHKPVSPKPKKKHSHLLTQQQLQGEELTDSPLPSPASLRQRYIKMYTGGVSSLAKHIASQLQTQEDSRAPLEKRDLGSLRKEFPQNIGGSDVCFFCGMRVYVMERLSAEGKFFHRSCFKCDYCSTTLRLSSYAFDVEDGKFYCKPHYCYRLCGQAQRKRPASSTAPLHPQERQVPEETPDSAESSVRGPASEAPGDRPPSVEMNGQTELSVVKRLKGTPERIELENYRLSMLREELQEVPEETLAEHNLSSILDKAAGVDEASSSSESDMEEDDEEAEPEAGPAMPSDLGGVAWKEAVEIHAKLKNGNEGRQASQVAEIEEDEEEDEEEEEEEEESSDEGQYYPWERELQSGLWLESLTDEEEAFMCTARDVHLRPVLKPLAVLLSQRDTQVAGGTGPDPRLSQAPSGTEPCEEEEEEDEDLDAEAGSPDIEPGTELDEDEIPSDAEADALSQHMGEELSPDSSQPEGPKNLCRTEPGSAGARELIVDVILSPVQKPSILEEQVIEKSPVLVKSPGKRFFPEPFLPDDSIARLPPSPTPDTNSPSLSAAVTSPIRSQPVSLPEAVPPPEAVPTPKAVAPSEAVTPTAPSPSEACACSPPPNPLSPICAQPLPCQESPTPLTTGSPVRTQPVPAITSTPLAKAPPDRTNTEPLKPLEETLVKKTDIIEEFWLKSAEIRRSLGLTPLDRTKHTEKSIVKTPTPDPILSKVHIPGDLSEEMKPTFTGRSVIRRLNITLEGQVISPVEPGSSGSDRKDLSCSSGLGLNDSTVTSQTATSDSYNNSDSTMLTPPSSPPPPPPNEEPAVLVGEKPRAVWDKTPAADEVCAVEEAPAKAPSPTSPLQSKPVTTPVPAPRTNPPVVMRTKDPNKPRRDHVRKSFVECVEEIPFADDVEDTFDERTPDTSALDRFYTPPTSRVNKERPPLHLALAEVNGKPNTPAGLLSKAAKGQPHVSPEAKEIAEERMREREKSVKSQALKDAMAKQLNKMKEADTTKRAVARAAWNVPEGAVKKRTSFPRSSAGKALETRQQMEPQADRFFSSPLSKSGDSSVTSSESSTGGKSKKRSSLFSPNKNKKEKKAKNESRLSGVEETPPKHKSLWKAVFSGYKKDKKKKEEKYSSSTPSSSTTVDSGKKKASPVNRSSDLRLRRNLSFSEDSDLSCDDVLERSSQKSKTDSVYVPHALAFKRSCTTKKTYTEEELNAKLTRRVQKAARRQAKQEELKRLHRAQIIQRQLEQVEEKQRQLEERGVAVEKALRGEAVEHYVGTPRWRALSFCPCCSPEGMGKKDDPKLMQEWFKLVQEKNALVRYESELMIFARELELEDRQSRLQQDLRERMAVDDHSKTSVELAEEKRILNEMLEVVEQRDSLVALLEEQRLREKEEDKDLEAVVLSKGFNLNWV
ncbi:protein-methionine sulfoxide oxidase mical3a isoform X3 [Brachyhypopomus gauderio]|uniref:protein-methionine sulfoxide oxidase mical3a isoform X3 n=1 Tax=Brachyhypopomus gauderio TaxID=698409 RepID=UPI004041B180